MHARMFVFSFLLLLSAGCLAPPEAPHFSPHDPVSPSATEPPLPPASDTLAIRDPSPSEAPTSTPPLTHDAHGGHQ
jgi:hypothetical protein